MEEPRSRRSRRSCSRSGGAKAGEVVAVAGGAAAGAGVAVAGCIETAIATVTAENRSKIMNEIDEKKET